MPFGCPRPCETYRDCHARKTRYARCLRSGSIGRGLLLTLLKVDGPDDETETIVVERRHEYSSLRTSPLSTPRRYVVQGGPRISLVGPERGKRPRQTRTPSAIKARQNLQTSSAFALDKLHSSTSPTRRTWPEVRGSTPFLRYYHLSHVVTCAFASIAVPLFPTPQPWPPRLRSPTMALATMRTTTPPRVRPLPIRYSELPPKQMVQQRRHGQEWRTPCGLTEPVSTAEAGRAGVISILTMGGR